VKEGNNLQAREAMAFADTLAGMSLSEAGAALPHPLGESIGSIYKDIPHGRTMAVIYPEFMRFSAINAVEKFAKVGHLLNPRLATVPDQIASVKMCNEFDNFLKKINMWYSLQDLGIDLQRLEGLPAMLAQFTVHFTPRPANEEDIKTILKKANKR